MIRILKKLISNFRRIRGIIKIAQLRLYGAHVDWSANIHSSVEIDCNGGSVTIGARTSIDKGVVIRAYGGQIKIGNDCTINPYSVIYGHGGLFIGDGVRIATHVIIIPSNHNFSDPNRFIFEQGETMQGVSIGDDVWLGAGVRVLDGVHIEAGSVIGAGSVVTKSTVPYGVYVGVPAKQISSRRTTDHN